MQDPSYLLIEILSEGQGGQRASASWAECVFSLNKFSPLTKAGHRVNTKLPVADQSKWGELGSVFLNGKCKEKRLTLGEMYKNIMDS